MTETTLTAERAGTRARIERIETIRIGAQPNVLWVEVTDEDGLRGLGETYYIPSAVEAVIHDMAAPLVLGMDALRIEEIWQTLFACANFYGYAGSEMRAFSALDVALWDLLGKRAGLSVSTLLGGRVRDEIRLYNTCVDAGGYDDMTAWLERPGDLAEELLADGFGGMKVWPWDRFAPQISSGLVTGPAGWSAMGPAGHDLTPDQLAEGLACIEAIRERVGMRIDVMLEGHSRWDLNAAIRICRAVEPYELAWVEDIIQPDSVADLARLVQETRVPQCVSERLIGKHRYRDVFEAGAAHLAMVDVVWTGGLTGGAQDRRPRRRLPPPGRPARLHRAGHARRLAAALRPRAQREADGSGARLPSRLVPRGRDEPDRGRRRPCADPRRARPGHGAPARGRSRDDVQVRVSSR